MSGPASQNARYTYSMDARSSRDNLKWCLPVSRCSIAVRLASHARASAAGELTVAKSCSAVSVVLARAVPPRANSRDRNSARVGDISMIALYIN